MAIDDSILEDLLIELVAKKIDKRQNYTWEFEGEPLKMFLLTSFKKPKYIAILTDKQAFRLKQLADIKKSIRELNK